MEFLVSDCEKVLDHVKQDFLLVVLTKMVLSVEWMNLYIVIFVLLIEFDHLT